MTEAERQSVLEAAAKVADGLARQVAGFCANTDGAQRDKWQYVHDACKDIADGIRALPQSEGAGA